MLFLLELPSEGGLVERLQIIVQIVAQLSAPFAAKVNPGWRNMQSWVSSGALAPRNRGFVEMLVAGLYFVANARICARSRNTPFESARKRRGPVRRPPTGAKARLLPQGAGTFQASWPGSGPRVDAETLAADAERRAVAAAFRARLPGSCVMGNTE